MALPTGGYRPKTLFMGPGPPKKVFLEKFRKISGNFCPKNVFHCSRRASDSAKFPASQNFRKFSWNWNPGVSPLNSWSKMEHFKYKHGPQRPQSQKSYTGPERIFQNPLGVFPTDRLRAGITRGRRGFKPIVACTSTVFLGS